MMLIDDLDYVANKDIRFDPEDKVDLYAFWRYSNGTVSWISAMERQLYASNLSLSILITVSMIAAQLW